MIKLLSTSKQRAKSICKLNMTYKEINIKHQAQVTYTGLVLDESTSGYGFKGYQ